MSDIELVIKIPESRYRLLQTQARTNLGKEKLDEFSEAVLNGTPLPKGHGRLVDLDALCDEHLSGCYIELEEHEISEIPVIIERTEGKE